MVLYFSETSRQNIQLLSVAGSCEGIPKSPHTDDTVSFLFPKTGGIPTKQWSVPSCFVFRKIYFLLEIGNPTPTTVGCSPPPDQALATRRQPYYSPTTTPVYIIWRWWTDDNDKWFKWWWFHVREHLFTKRMPIQIQEEPTARLLLRRVTEESKAQNRCSWVSLDRPPSTAR